MIRLTRLNQKPLVLNAELIAYVESTPDTLVTLSNGNRVHVRETVDQVVDRVIAYKARILQREPASLVGAPEPVAGDSDK